MKADSVFTADTLSPIQSELAVVAEKIANTPTEVLIGDFIEKAISFGLKVLAAFIIYFLGAWLIKKIKKILARMFERKKTDAAISSFVQSIASLAMTVILIIITVGTLGIDTSSIAALLTGGGLAIGMALNGTVQNFAGGIMLLIFKPFKAGDYIEAMGYEGTVSEVNIVSTKLTTVDNRCIVIPNGGLSNGTINNYSENKIRRVDWKISVEYGASSEKTKSILLELLEKDDRILKGEQAPAAPFVALDNLADSAVVFVIRAWVKSSDYWNVKFDMNERIYNELPKHDIVFPYPKMDVFVNRSK